MFPLLGRGGMSSVYLAEHTGHATPLCDQGAAIQAGRNKASLGRFHREAQQSPLLDDPEHRPRAYDVDQVKEGSTEIHFPVSGDVEGRSSQVVDDDDPSIAEARSILVSEPWLKHAHAVGRKTRCQAKQPVVRRNGHRESPRSRSGPHP
ncbi:MAG: hypothetical protein R3C02_05590 [Planctomycetaceae bacterium]